MRRLWLARGEVELSYLDTDGEGPVVLLLHGLAGSAREFVPTAAALRDGYRVLALDQRGHGHSTRRPADTSRRAYVEDVAAVIGAVAGGPVTLVGQSMGAHTALLAACWHPGLVRRLVMLEGGVGGGDPGLPAALGAWFASWPRPFPSRAAAVEHLGGTPLAHAWARDLDQRADGFWPRFDPDVMQAAIAAVVQTARWPEWRRVRAPTLLVQGEHGSIDREQIATMLAERPGTEHAVLPDAGHDAHLDHPDAWARLLRHYLDSGHPSRVT